MFLPFFLPSAPDLRFELIYRTSVKIILFHEIKNILCKKNVSLKKAHGSKLSRSSVENFKHNSELKKLTIRFITLVQTDTVHNFFPEKEVRNEKARESPQARGVCGDTKLARRARDASAARQPVRRAGARVPPRAASHGTRLGQPASL